MMSSNPSSDAGSEWSSKRREITYQEARTVLDTQQATIESIDTKALRTARLTAIVIGVLISLVEALGVSVSVSFAYAGALALLLSFASSIATYNASNLTLGPNRRYLTQLIDGDFETSETEPEDEIEIETAWELDLLQTLGYWIEENADIIVFNSQLLILSEILLLIGILLSAVGIVF